MKKILFFSVVCLLCFVSGTYAQHFENLSECKSMEDTLHYLQQSFKEEKYAGKPFKEILDAFREILPIKYVASDRTSPWLDKDGRSYISGITIFYQHARGVTKGRQVWFNVHFEDTHADDDEFTQKVAKEDRGDYNRYVNYFQDFIVKSIDIHIWDWDTKKEIN